MENLQTTHRRTTSVSVQLGSLLQRFLSLDCLSSSWKSLWIKASPNVHLMTQTNDLFAVRQGTLTTPPPGGPFPWVVFWSCRVLCPEQLTRWTFRYSYRCCRNFGLYESKQQVLVNDTLTSPVWETQFIEDVFNVRLWSSVYLHEQMCGRWNSTGTGTGMYVKALVLCLWGHRVRIPVKLLIQTGCSHRAHTWRDWS